jgi:hypothetical protein
MPEQQPQEDFDEQAQQASEESREEMTSALILLRQEKHAIRDEISQLRLLNVPNMDVNELLQLAVDIISLQQRYANVKKDIYRVKTALHQQQLREVMRLKNRAMILSAQYAETLGTLRSLNKKMLNIYVAQDELLLAMRRQVELFTTEDGEEITTTTDNNSSGEDEVRRFCIFDSCCNTFEF